jgi:uncharacterized protein (DUF1697 family)
MPAVAAFIRGINLGPNKRVPMAELRTALEALGYEDPKTLLASGNVVLETSKRPAAVAADVEKVIAAEFGHDVVVIARTAKQLAAIVKANPFAGVATNGSMQFVAFLADRPKATVLRELEQEDFGDDQWVAAGDELHYWCPNGLRDSRMIKTLTEKRLGVTATVRNWNTVVKVHDLLS